MAFKKSDAFLQFQNTNFKILMVAYVYSAVCSQSSELCECVENMQFLNSKASINGLRECLPLYMCVSEAVHVFTVKGHL